MMTSPQSTAGYTQVEVPDEPGHPDFPMVVMYPASAPERPERMGAFTLEVASKAEPRPGRFPLALISHGSGGSHLAYRTLGRHLARHGFIVGMPQHPHNNRVDNSLEGRIENLLNRPRHLKATIDWFFANEAFAKNLQPDAVSVIGHSMGGYAALALAGGVPTSLPHESKDREPHLLTQVAHDRRVRALVLLAPATAWFWQPGALGAVDLPILMMVGDRDFHTPADYHTRPVLAGVADPARVTCRVIGNAGHFSFLSEFPESMRHPGFAPSQDPAGFDRSRFLDEMNAEVLAFLQRASAGMR